MGMGRCDRSINRSIDLDHVVESKGWEGGRAEKAVGRGVWGRSSYPDGSARTWVKGSGNTEGACVL